LEDELKGMLPKVNSKVTKRVGALKSNKNALGNCGGDPLDILWNFIFKKGDKKSPPHFIKLMDSE